jgi:putative transposase
MSPNARWHVTDGGIYHLVTRGNNRMGVFRTSNDFKAYLEILHKYKIRHPIFLHHYCLMSNHVHLLVRVEKREALKKFMQGVNQSYSNYYKRVYEYCGHLWQGRFKSFLIEKDNYLLECGRYIERNPLRAGIVEDPSGWPWSSYRHYAIGETNPSIDTHGLYLDLGCSPQDRQNCYRDYVMQERPYEALLDKQFQVVQDVRA